MTTDAPTLADFAEALGAVRESDGAPLALDWPQVLDRIRELRDERDECRAMIDERVDNNKDDFADIRDQVNHLAIIHHDGYVKVDAKQMKRLLAAIDERDARLHEAAAYIGALLSKNPHGWFCVCDIPISEASLSVAQCERCRAMKVTRK